ncbi:MAG: hypothetical protein V3S33_08455 [Gammaproteobacteria bacterium]
MSDALSYLLTTRPDAIKPYFKFLKESGKHLDVKTRDLISVITKVHAQTEGGLRQYLSRAMRNGCSASEGRSLFIYRTQDSLKVYDSRCLKKGSESIFHSL